MSYYQKRMDNAEDNFNQQSDIINSRLFRTGSSSAANTQAMTNQSKMNAQQQQMQAGMNAVAGQGAEIDNSAMASANAQVASNAAVTQAQEAAQASQQQLANLSAYHSAKDEIYKWQQERKDAMKNTLINSATQLASSAMSSFSPV